MNIKKILKVISALIALAGIAAAVYFAVQKLTAKKEPEYFDDDEFFECDNEIEIVEANDDETVVEETPEQEEAPKAAPKKKAAKKTAKKKAE